MWRNLLTWWWVGLFLALMAILLAGTLIPALEFASPDKTGLMMTAIGLLLVAVTTELQRRDLQATLAEQQRLRGEHHAQTLQQETTESRTHLFQMFELFRLRSDEFVAPSTFDNQAPVRGTSAFRAVAVLPQGDIDERRDLGAPGSDKLAMHRKRWLRSVVVENESWYGLVELIPKFIKERPELAKDRDTLMEVFRLYITPQMRTAICLKAFAAWPLMLGDMDFKRRMEPHGLVDFASQQAFGLNQWAHKVGEVARAIERSDGK